MYLLGLEEQIKKKRVMRRCDHGDGGVEGRESFTRTEPNIRRFFTPLLP